MLMSREFSIFLLTIFYPIFAPSVYLIFCDFKDVQKNMNKKKNKKIGENTVKQDETNEQ